MKKHYKLIGFIILLSVFLCPLVGVGEDSEPAKKAAAIKKLIKDNMLENAYDDITQSFEPDDDSRIVLAVRQMLARAYYQRGIGYTHKLGYPNAIADYTKAIKLDSEFAEAYYNRAFAYYAIGQYDTAIKDYTNVIEINPEYAEAYHNRGFAYDKNKDYSSVAKDQSEAVKINPYYIMTYSQISSISSPARPSAPAAGGGARGGSNPANLRPDAAQRAQAFLNDPAAPWNRRDPSGGRLLSNQ
ncbi:MAG: tetratricopeptide repeat protein, partial [Planctomycetes bacterium]|nr:tetratricopeptide repeat protein [Planctomycetota bacterium]